MHLTEPDDDIIWLVHQHSFLRSNQIVAIMGGSPQQILRRLKLLYHHGYAFDGRREFAGQGRGLSKARSYRIIAHVVLLEISPRGSPPQYCGVNFQKTHINLLFGNDLIF
jgi:hypothetical protein